MAEEAGDAAQVPEEAALGAVLCGTAAPGSSGKGGAGLGSCTPKSLPKMIRSLPVFWVAHFLYLFGSCGSPSRKDEVLGGARSAMPLAFAANTLVAQASRQFWPVAFFNAVAEQECCPLVVFGVSVCVCFGVCVSSGRKSATRHVGFPLACLWRQLGGRSLLPHDPGPLVRCQQDSPCALRSFVAARRPARCARHLFSRVPSALVLLVPTSASVFASRRLPAPESAVSTNSPIPR